MSSNPTPIVFFDLDGTIIKGKDDLGHFIKDPTEVELYDGVYEKLRDLKSKGCRLVLVTNQGGIATGHIQESTVQRILQEVSRLTANLWDRISYCPHFPIWGEFTEPDQMEKQYCFCRKPIPGSIFGAMSSLQEQYRDEYYRPWTCWLVGDMGTDRQCAEAAGISFVHALDWRENGISGV